MFPVIPADTTPEAWAWLIERYRRMTPAEKLRRVALLNVRAREAALAGIRLRHPDATPREERLYLAALLLGDDLVKAAFDWDPAVRGR